MPGANFGKALYHRCKDDGQVRQLSPLYYRGYDRKFKPAGAYHCGHCGLGYWEAVPLRNLKASPKPASHSSASAPTAAGGC